MFRLFFRNRRICCDLFEGALKPHGEQGFGIVPVHDVPLQMKMFRMEFWSIPKDEIEIGEASHIHTAKRIILSFERAIQYCPFCGMNLRAFYAGTFDDLPHVLTES